MTASHCCRIVIVIVVGMLHKRRETRMIKSRLVQVLNLIG